jgi:hypothetical protein
MAGDTEQAQGAAAYGGDAEAQPIIEDKPETPDDFLTKLSATLKSTADVDTDLAGILADHLLMVAPNANAVANAKATIIALAGQRATRYKGEGCLVAMLNARLSNATYMPYANLIEAMLADTRARHWLDRSSLQTALSRARSEAEQITPGHAVWDAAMRLFPEVLDGLVRAELIDLT